MERTCQFGNKLFDNSFLDVRFHNGLTEKFTFQLKQLVTKLVDNNIDTIRYDFTTIS